MNVHWVSAECYEDKALPTRLEGPELDRCKSCEFTLMKSSILGRNSSTVFPDFWCYPNWIQSVKYTTK